MPINAHPTPRTPSHCPACQRPAARDQRYCLACGERLTPPRAEVQRAISRAPAHPVAAPPVARPVLDAGDALTDLPALTPLQSAAAVLSVLAFGVVAGGVAAPTTSYALVPQPRQPAAATAPATTVPVAADAADDSAAADEGDILPAVAAGGDEPVAEPAAAEDAPAGGDAAPTTPATDPNVPPIKHVFLVVLSGQGYQQAFGPDSASPYLSQELPKQGELLQNYYAVSQSPLSNAIALVSGQGPTPETLDNCPTFADLSPATPGADGQALGTGCVFPAGTRTIGDQLKEAGDTWRAYLGGFGTTSCRHPQPGAADDAREPGTDGYVTWRNPFAYFHSVTDDAAGCGEHLADLSTIDTDLSTAATTPSLSYIVPDRCHDGSDVPCAPGAPAGLAAADEGLRTLIPKLQRSPAYRDGGLIVITFDGAPQTGDHADASGCCQMPVYPNVPAPATPEPTTPGLGPAEIGGGQVGALLLSDYVEPGSLNTINSYNHFSLLKSLETLFGVDQLGYAAMPTLLPFDKGIWNASPAS